MWSRAPNIYERHKSTFWDLQTLLDNPYPQSKWNDVLSLPFHTQNEIITKL